MLADTGDAHEVALGRQTVENGRGAPSKAQYILERLRVVVLSIQGSISIWRPSDEGASRKHFPLGRRLMEVCAIARMGELAV